MRQALEAAGAAKSAKDYLHRSVRLPRAPIKRKKIKARLDQLSRQNAALSEEEQIRQALALQYGTRHRRCSMSLVRKELELARAKKQANDETERSIQVEAQRTAGSGGVVNWPAGGKQPAAQLEAAGHPAARRRRWRAQIVINAGMTTDQARQFVEQSVVPELERINRLSR